MLTSVFNFLEKTVTDFSWKRLITFILFLIVSIIIVLLFEWYTDYFALSRLEKEVQLLKEISLLTEQHTSNPKLKPIYNGLIKELNFLVNHKTTFPGLSPFFLRILTGSAPWLLLTMLFVPGVKKGSTDRSTIAGGLVLTFIFAIISILLPSNWSPTILYIVFPIGSVITLSILALLLQAIKRRKKLRG